MMEMSWFQITSTWLAERVS